MKILVFGASGMIGHKMMLRLQTENFEVLGTLHKPLSNYYHKPLFKKLNFIDSVDVTDSVKVLHVLESVRPDVILNCVGITLRKPKIKDLQYSLKVNSEFPQFLKMWTEKNSKYLIHFSTDCVFTGKATEYTEDSQPDAIDVYGLTKTRGEVFGPACLTLRGSQLGSELFGKTELFEWALSHRNKSIKGFTKAIYTGMTTNIMAELVAKLALNPQKLTGLYQVSSAPISKYELLAKINDKFNLNMSIQADGGYATNKVLSSQKIAKEIGFNCPSWDDMLNELKKDRVLNSEIYEE